MQQSSSKGCLPVFLRVVNIMAIAGLALAALLFLLSGLDSLDGTSAGFLANALPSLSFAALMSFLLVLQAFSLARSFKPDLPGPAPAVDSGKSYLIATVLLPAWGLGMAAGQLIINHQVLLFLLPFIQLIVVALPLWWFVELGRHKLPLNPSFSLWGTASFSAAVVPLLTMILEVVLIVILAFLMIIGLSMQPGWSTQILRLYELSQGTDPNALNQWFMEALQDPLLMTVIIVFVSLLVPIVEELCKALGVTVFGGRRLTPAQGFSLGLISGAVFGFIESVMMLSTSYSGDWYLMVMLRAGTTLLHTATAALTGWGLASAFSQRKTGRMFLAFLGAILLHGVWNGFGVMVGISPVTTSSMQTNVLISTPRDVLCLSVLGLLTIGMLVLLVIMNSFLRRDPLPEPEPAYPPPLPLA